MMSGRSLARITRKILAFRHDLQASSAVEFSLVVLPFILTILMILQMGIYYMTQSALDTGMIQTADSLVNSFNTSSIPTTPSVSSLQTQIVQGAGGLVHSASLQVDLQPFQNLTSGAVAIGANAPNIGSPRSLLVLRAQANVTTFMPGVSSLLVVRSSTVLRRQTQ